MTPQTITLPPEAAAAHALERARIAELRRAISERIEADLALLNGLDISPDDRPEMPSTVAVTAKSGGQLA